MSEERYSENTAQVPAGSGENNAGFCDRIDTPLAQPGSGSVHGYTYFVRKDAEIKIGFTARPKRRMKELAREFPGSVVVSIVSASVIGEFEAHQRFDHLRISQDSEWFRVTPELLTFISSLPPADTTAAPLPRREKPAPESPVVTAIRGKIRREPEGVRKEQLELMAAMIENGVPALYLRRQVGLMAA